jgi:uncharacterized protein YqgV (UPF0045/DUF77 family)
MNKVPETYSPGRKYRECNRQERRRPLVTSEWSIIPGWTKSSTGGQYEGAAIQELEHPGTIRIRPGAKGTVIEAENLNDLFRAIGKSHNSVSESGVGRVIGELRMEDRRDSESPSE